MSEYSPMMKHYIDIKEQYKDCIVFYRLGDFYEMFFEDAITASRELEITLTGRDCGKMDRAPMCGVPFHSAENYISRLIEKGYKVAICEQIEDAKEAKGIVARDVVRVVTPGTVVDANMLDEKKNNYIMSIFKKGIYFGMAVCDVTTGEFLATKLTETNNFALLLDEISKYNPAEIICNQMLFDCKQEIDEIRTRFSSYINRFSDDLFSEETEKLLNNYSISGAAVTNDPKLEKHLFEVASINGLLAYLTQTQKIKLEHINNIKIYNVSKYMTLDIAARRNLELTERMSDKGKKGTLLWVLDKTCTSMGGRLLRKWINEPLLDISEINKRLNAVKELKQNLMLRDELTVCLKHVYDIERLVGKISYGNSNARDMVSLKNSLKQLPEIKELLQSAKSDMLKELYANLDVCSDIHEHIEKAIIDEPPITIKEGGIIKQGYNQQVDEYKKAGTEGKQWLLELEIREKELTGIKNLKIGFNKIFGYFIEITKSNLSMVPERFVRKQTLANCERYITEELNEIESKILGAEEKVVDLEYNLFIELRSEIAKNIKRLQKASNIVSVLDVIGAFANVAEDMEYVFPEMSGNDEIKIKAGRHPVIEKMLPTGSFVQNDTYLSREERLSIITGPNMAGKSTYMRQVALITLMAQIGSFVPAESAKIGIVDKIFTRVGASDDLSMGQSTFMVEMMEMASILKNATSKSLIVLDEIGRGTSTYDGLSIAWAVAEYIQNLDKCGAKTLFATHYHELTELENKLEGVKNYSVAVKEKGEDIVFLRKIVPVGTDESYGIHVAKLAGVPANIVTRANQILKTLEKKKLVGGTTDETSKSSKKQEGQLDMYNYKLAEIAHELDKISLDELTPIDALNALVKIKEKMK